MIDDMALLSHSVSFWELPLLSLILYVTSTIVYAFFLSPVRHVPGPWHARVSRLPLLYATYKFRRTAYAAGILARYGVTDPATSSTTVLVAPDDILTTDEAAMKIIYDKSSIKTPFYASMGSWKGIKSTLGFLDYASAAPTRNNLLACFQNRNLDTLCEAIQAHVWEFVAMLRRKAQQDEKSKLIDGVVAFRLLALDVVTDVLWGEEKTLLSEMNDSTTTPPVFLRRFTAFSRWNAFKSFVPGADLYVRWCGSKKWKDLRNDCNDLDLMAKEALARWDEKRGVGEKKRHHDRDVLSMLRSMQDAEDPLKRVPIAHLPAYIVEMLAAGSSTTSHTVTFACYLLARHDDAQLRLRRELFEQFPDPTRIEPRNMMGLPFLDAVLKETMRMYPMIPGPLERYLGKAIEIGGRSVPKGIIASTAPYTQGRRADVFPEPENWRPERWLDAVSTGDLKRMEMNWIPFGTGCRACPGANLAFTELKYMIGTIFRIFRSIVPPGHETDVLELADVFAAGSKTGHCWLRFELAEQSV